VISGPVAYSFAAQHRDAVRRMAIFDVPVNRATARR
jgi:hypothetical protein